MYPSQGRTDLGQPEPEQVIEAIGSAMEFLEGVPNARELQSNLLLALQAAQEQRLLNAVHSARDEEVRRFALVQLSQLGGTDSLLAINALCADRWTPPALRSVGEEALLKIRTRLDRNDLSSSTRSSGVVKEIRTQITELLEEARRVRTGPELTNFSGAACVNLCRGGSEERLRADEQGAAYAPPGADCDLVCWLDPRACGEVGEEAMFVGSIEVHNGVDRPQIELTVELDCDTLHFESPLCTLTFAVGAASPLLCFPFTVPELPGEHRIWVQVSQQKRLLEVVPLKVIVEAEGEEDPLANKQASLRVPALPAWKTLLRGRRGVIR